MITNLAINLHPRILLVEDDLDLCRGWGEIFDLLGYDHVSFHRGLQALENRDVIQKSNILITDYYLPDINGVELIRRLREIRPDMKCIMLTGSRELSVVDSVKKISQCEILHKPVSIDVLELKLNSILASA